ncbi:MAG: hypothetical protein ACW99L_08095, partial [Promethearchaeota archaeon]
MSLDFLNAFKFMKKKSFLHNLDPRAKLVLAIVYTISGLLFKEIVPLLFIFLTLIPLIIIGRIFKQWIKSIRALSYLIIFIIVLNTLFYKETRFSFAIAMVLRIYIMM